MSDEYEAAIEGEQEAADGSDAAPSERDAGDDFDRQAEAGSGIPITRRGRVISDKVREAFKIASKGIKEQLAAGDDDEFEPAIDAPEETTSPETGSTATTQAAVSPMANSGQPQLPSAPAPAPSLDPQVQAKLQALDARAAELEAQREAFAKQQASSDLGRLHEVYLEKGAGPAFVEIVKLWTGASTDSEIAEEIADVITELSGHSLGVSVPNEIKTRLDSKRALKSVKATQAKLDKREQDIQSKAAKQAEQENLQRTIRAIDTEVRKPELAKQYPFLTVEPNAGELIYETVEAHVKRGGDVMKWTDAAKLVNDYLETKWREEHGKRAHLLVATPANAGAAVAGKTESAQGDPQGLRRSRTLANAQTASAGPRTPPEPTPGKWSPEDHRARTKARMRQAFKPSE